MKKILALTFLTLFAVSCSDSTDTNTEATTENPSTESIETTEGTK